MHKGYTVTNKDILAYYDLHGGSGGVFGLPVGDAKTKNGILYQDFAGGVIVKYPNGTVTGHTQLRYLLEHIEQTGKIGDGYKDNDLEMYIVVTLEQDGTYIEKSKRWPDYSSKKHGGKKFDIVYSGNAVTLSHTNGSSVFYDTMTIHGDTRIRLVIEVWDYDYTNANDHIRDYVFELDITNGWGYDMDIPLKFTSKTMSNGIKRYTGVYHPDDKIKLNMVVKSLGPYHIEDNDITRYYLAHGGEKGIYGHPVSVVYTTKELQFQNFAGGVIVKYKNGTVAGHTKLKFILEHIKQTGAFNDGNGDKNMELYVVVKMLQDRAVLVQSDRWPDDRSRKHGGKEFDIIYEGTISADNPKGVNISYNTLLIRGGTNIFLNVEVWDFDQYNHDDYIRTFSFDLNINNGWGVDMDIPYKYSTKKRTGDTVSYKEICHSDGKIKLDMSIQSPG